MKINIRLTESEAELLKKKKEQTGKNTTEILKVLSILQELTRLLLII